MTRSWRWLPTIIATAAVAVIALMHVGLLLHCFSARVGYPLDLEWMEGGMLCHALRIMEGKALYAEPSVEFISFLYTPLYPLLLAGLGKLIDSRVHLGAIITQIKKFDRASY